ncbi:uncharacterized protein [Halyomorpha halys]|uniref:uncharacterized protein isoform X2 n=1 Tax=Halyomorpha halys TaxID=286706 RepID=UPI0006D51EB0|nr:uncharacterized protein LOC106683624 isoform X1 [Halyomorpha halys]
MFTREMDHGVLENILKNTDNEKAVQSVLGVEEVVPLTECVNYKSTFTRIVVKVVLGNGKTVKKSLILKNPQTENGAVTEKTLNLFETEIKVNTSLLKEMGFLMDDFQDSGGIMWSKLLHHEPCNTLVFEDLEAEGFKHIQWNSTLDADHCILVLRTLGKYHGISKVLEGKGVFMKEDFNSACHFLTDENFIKNFFITGFQVLKRGILRYWGLSWDSVAERLKIPEELLNRRLKEIAELSETRFNVLNHGDCWLNNFMFKYDMDSKPYKMRFMNFQRSFYNSPCLDITFFMYTSIDATMRRNHFDRLLKCYYDSLVSTLDKYGFRGTKPTYDEISSDMDRVSFFGLCIFSVYHAVLIADKKNSSTIDYFYSSEGKPIGVEIYKNKSLIDQMIPDIISFIQMAGL